MRRVLVSAFVVAALVGLAAPAGAGETKAPAEAKKGVTVGALKCNEAGGWGLVFGATRDLKCIFTPAKKGEPVRFTGKIKKYGVDIGYQQDAVIYWAVLSTSEKFQPGEVAGKYVGATADVAWAVGLGANVLAGGSKKGFALQPVSVAGSTGANVAAGLAEVELTAVKK
jgi:hypothetical protein